MSLASALQTAMTVNIEGVDYAFERLDCYDLAKLDEARKHHLKQLAEQHGQKLTPFELANLLMDIDARSTPIGEMLAHAYSAQGATAALELSLKKGGLTPDKAKALVTKLTASECATVAQELILRPGFEAKKEEKPNDPPAEAAVTTENVAAEPKPEAPALDATTSTPSKADKNKCFGE